MSEEKITVELNRQEMQYLLNVLAARPFNEVNGLIVNLNTQIQSKQPKTPEEPK